MLNKGQLDSAIRYNTKRVATGDIDVDLLPFPWDSERESAFSWSVALFQSEKGLGIDGKLGPNTLRAIEKAQDDTSVEVPVKPSVPPETGISNAVVYGGVLVELPRYVLDAGVTATNYREDGEIHFKHKDRTDVLQHFVLHETCGNTAQGVKNTLERKGYGVQLILSPEGHLSCHGDLSFDRMVHANQLNNTSFGIEVVNPYAPMYVNNNLFDKTMPAEWWTWCPDKNDRRYVMPTDAQMKAVKVLIPWLCELTGVPYVFPTRHLGSGQRHIVGWDARPKAKPEPGVVAHRDFASHGDGRYMLETLMKDKEC